MFCLKIYVNIAYVFAEVQWPTVLWACKRLRRLAGRWADERAGVWAFGWAAGPEGWRPGGWTDRAGMRLGGRAG